MNLYLVRDTQYVLADGVAGATYLDDLANNKGLSKAKLIVSNITKTFKPRCIGTDEAMKFIKR